MPAMPPHKNGPACAATAHAPAPAHLRCCDVLPVAKVHEQNVILGSGLRGKEQGVVRCEWREQAFHLPSIDCDWHIVHMVWAQRALHMKPRCQRTGSAT